MVAFFELPKGETGTADRNSVAAMQHCSFTTTKAQFEVLFKRLQEHQVSVIGPLNVGSGSWSMYFLIRTVFGSNTPTRKVMATTSAWLSAGPRHARRRSLNSLR